MLDFSQLEDFVTPGTIRRSAVYRLRENTKETRSNKAMIDFANFRIEFGVRIYADNGTQKITWITEDILKNRNIKLDYVVDHAFRLTPEDVPPVLRKMDPALTSFYGGYVLTNSWGRYGASTMLYPGLLNEIAETVHDDFYVFTASQHELFLFPINEANKQKFSIDWFKNWKNTLSGDTTMGDIYRYFADYDEIMCVSDKKGKRECLNDFVESRTFADCELKASPEWEAAKQIAIENTKNFFKNRQDKSIGLSK